MKQRLLAQIATWDVADDRFFTDEQLCQRFGVSRLTVRQAVQSLVEDGFLVRARGAPARRYGATRSRSISRRA
ncbi:MAG: GntR family transcriptional regulator [Pseudomonadota bacterium]